MTADTNTNANNNSIGNFNNNTNDSIGNLNGIFTIGTARIGNLRGGGTRAMSSSASGDNSRYPIGDVFTAVGTSIDTSTNTHSGIEN